MSGRCCKITSGAAIIGIALIVTIVAVLTRPGTASPQTVPPSMITPVRSFKGSHKTISGGSTVVRYAGIPFAKPPIGDFRFKPPQPLQDEPSDLLTTFDASELKKSCWSVTKKADSPYYDEDCLYLNVYVPNYWPGQDLNATGLYPVVVWIHGGGFIAGSVLPEPYKFVARSHVIVVTINYRLGVFGFLTTEDDLIPANNGLWDQVFALKWVKENIESFGGDPNSITIFGESAGSMSAAIHAISPVSSNLFHRVLMQSGSASSLIRRNPVYFAQQFGNNTGCGDEISNEFVDCLRNLSIETILEYSMSVDLPEASKLVDFFWMPTIDKNIIPDEPIKLLNNVSYLKSINAFDKDYLFGLNNNDGSMALNTLPTNMIFDLNSFKTLTNHLLHVTLGLPTDVLKKVSDAVTSFYLEPQPSDQNIKKETVMDLTADALFYAPGFHMATTVSGCYEDPALQVCDSQINEKPECVNASGRSYVYVFDYCPPRDGCNLPCMTHGRDVQYQFPKRPFESQVDRQLSDNFIDMLSDFIKTGKPGLNLKTSKWPAYEKNLQSYLSFSPISVVKQYFHPYRMKFWLSEIPRIIKNTV